MHNRKNNFLQFYQPMMNNASMLMFPIFTCHLLDCQLTQSQQRIQSLEIDKTELKTRWANDLAEKQRMQQALQELNNELANKIAQVEELQRTV